MKVEGYDLHLYCDNDGCQYHRWRQYQIDEPTKSLAHKQARKQGWVLGKKDICPKCNKQQED